MAEVVDAGARTGQADGAGSASGVDTTARLGAEPPLAERWQVLDARGWLAADAFPTRAAELAAVREVAIGGLGSARVFDGHRNGLERVLAHRPDDVDAGFRERAAAGEVRLGVWGADPAPGEGDPACLDASAATVTGVKTFCSGAGRLDAAIVLVRRTPDGPPIVPALVDLTGEAAVQVDQEWFRAPVLAESHSHRVVFERAPVLAVLGAEGTLVEEPWISGDALRSAAVWAGAADVLLDRMTRVTAGDGAHERIGRAAAIVRGVDAWLSEGLAAVEAAHAAGPDPWPTIAALRLELTERLRELMRLAAEHLGSRGLVTDRKLIEARGGLDVLLLQHRLAPAAARLGKIAAEVDAQVAGAAGDDAIASTR